MKARRPPGRVSGEARARETPYNSWRDIRIGGRRVSVFHGDVNYYALDPTTREVVGGQTHDGVVAILRRSYALRRRTLLYGARGPGDAFDWPSRSLAEFGRRHDRWILQFEGARPSVLARNQLWGAKWDGDGEVTSGCEPATAEMTEGQARRLLAQARRMERWVRDDLLARYPSVERPNRRARLRR